MWPDKRYFAELFRPWKLVTFAIGMAWLIYGALNYNIGDWDIGISLIMGTLAYVCAPWSVGVILTSIRDRSRLWPLWVLAALLPAWFTVDGSYVLYHSAMGNQMLRAENFWTSSVFYFMAGCLWLYRGSLRQFLTNIHKFRF